MYTYIYAYIDIVKTIRMNQRTKEQATELLFATGSETHFLLLIY